MHMAKKQSVGRHHVARKCDLFAIPETWWDECHDWSVTINEYRLFRRDRRQRRGRRVALHIKSGIECGKLCLKNSHGLI